VSHHTTLFFLYFRFSFREIALNSQTWPQEAFPDDAASIRDRSFSPPEISPSSARYVPFLRVVMLSSPTLVLVNRAGQSRMLSFTACFRDNSQQRIGPVWQTPFVAMSKVPPLAVSARCFAHTRFTISLGVSPLVTLHRQNTPFYTVRYFPLFFFFSAPFLSP